MREDDPERFKEHNVDHRAVEVDALVRRVETERERRIARLYPVSLQVQMIAAGVVLLLDKGLSSDERRVVETDASALHGFMRCMTKHRLAAELLANTIRKPGADLKKINPTEESWWK